MNKVISIHLCGVAFQLEENGYDALRSYLDDAGHQLAANPDKTEILADIERAIADKFRALLKSGRNVVLSPEVEAVLREIGPVADDLPAAAGANHPGPPPLSASEPGRAEPSYPPKRLYRIKEGAMISGVCNGLAVYLGADVTLIRLIVAICVFISVGVVAVGYIVAILVVPVARTAEQKAAAAGPMPTAREFIRRSREGYYSRKK